jgi:DNA-binding transcriptional regulator YhcF (GntR family)
MTEQTPGISVDTSSAVAPYEQIRHQLDELIRGGQLRPGQRLPPVRQLATDLGLAAGTVARAYRELELAGRVHTRRGGGTAVASPDPAMAAGEALAPLAAAYVAQARRIGASDRDLIRAVRKATLS